MQVLRYEPSDPIKERVDRARELLLEAMELHDDEGCEHGNNCAFGLGLAAYIAHCLGCNTSTRINFMESELDRYNRECPHCTERN